MKKVSYKPSSAYVHIPFCTQICYYCDFAKVYIKNQPVDAYITALLEEVAAEKISELKTLYIGGGTPTVLSASQLDRLMSSLEESFDLAAATSSPSLNNSVYDNHLLDSDDLRDRL